MCKEHEKKVSRVIFKTVVVPFNRDRFDLTQTRQSVKANPNVGVEDKGDPPVRGLVAPAFRGAPVDVYWSTAKPGSVYDGMKVFEAWGRHITKFGMSFELDEGKLIEWRISYRRLAAAWFWLPSTSLHHLQYFLAIRDFLYMFSWMGALANSL